MALPPDDQDDVDGADQASKRGDVIRAKMHQLQTRIEVLRQEAREADRLAAKALQRRKLLTKAKTVGGGFLLKLPAALWNDELQSAFRLGAVNCRKADQDAWKVLLADLETAWFAKSDDKKPGATSERASFETGQMQLSPPKTTGAASAANSAELASQASEPIKTDPPAVSQEPAMEASPPPDVVASQSDGSSSSVDTPPAAAPASDPAPAPSAAPSEPSPSPSGLDATSPSRGEAHHSMSGGGEGPTVTERAGPMHEAITTQQFLQMVYKRRQALMLAHHPVLLQLTEEELSNMEYVNEAKKIKDTQALMRKAQP